MGLYRVLRRSVRFTFRNKRRFLVFVLIFGIISTIIAFNIDELDTLQTDELLEQKGVIIKKQGGSIVTYDQGNLLYNDILQYARSTDQTSIERSAVYTYADLDPILSINSIEVNDPWLSDFANPSLVISGRFPSQINEILVPTGSFQARNINNSQVEIRANLAVGQELVFTNNAGNTINLEIVGTFDVSRHDISKDENDLWLFMDSVMFDQMLTLFGMDTSNVFTYMMSFVTEGVFLLPETFEKTQVLDNEITRLRGDSSSYGNWGEPQSRPPAVARSEANSILVILGFVVIGGVILSTLFAYIISRFRRREIAILKAMGYSHTSVRSTLIGEILTVSFAGFIFGLSIAQALLLRLNNWDLTSLIRFQAIGVAFIIMVVISLPGMIFASRRVLGVSPAEAFRDI